MQVSEYIKIEMSNTNLNYSNWLPIGNQCFEFVYNIKEFSSSSKFILEQTEKIITRILNSVGLKFSDINNIIFVGGTSKLPFIKQYWQDKLNSTNQKLIYHDPMNAVAKGAALYANTLDTSVLNNKSKMELHGVSTYNIALKQKHARNLSLDIIIYKNSPLPSKGIRNFYLPYYHTLHLELIQFWDENDEIFHLGNINIGPLEQAVDVEVIIECRSNGTIGLKIKESNSNKPVKFEFKRSDSVFKFDKTQQQSLVDNVFINNIV
jgi:molecular chaperone DnaK (HSP70)